VVLLKRYGLELILGDRERGKTTLGVLEMVSKLDDHTYEKGFGNITIEHPRYKKIGYEDLYKLREPAPHGVPTALLYLDQLHKYLDSRQPMCPRNKYVNDVMIESRQHGFDCTGTTWGYSFIDLRYRKFANLEVQAKRTRSAFVYTFWDREAMKIWNKKLTFANAQKWWERFDTTELVEDIDPRWDPRLTETPKPLKRASGARGRRLGRSP
jgi:hypothetical protein